MNHLCCQALNAWSHLIGEHNGWCLNHFHYSKKIQDSTVRLSIWSNEKHGAGLIDLSQTAVKEVFQFLALGIHLGHFYDLQGCFFCRAKVGPCSQHKDLRSAAI